MYPCYCVAPFHYFLLNRICMFVECSRICLSPWGITDLFPFEVTAHSPRASCLCPHPGVLRHTPLQVGGSANLQLSWIIPSEWCASGAFRSFPLWHSSVLLPHVPSFKRKLHTVRSFICAVVGPQDLAPAHVIDPIKPGVKGYMK